MCILFDVRFLFLSKNYTLNRRKCHSVDSFQESAASRVYLTIEAKVQRMLLQYIASFSNDNSLANVFIFPSCSVIKSQFISSFAAYSRNSVVLPVLFKNYPMTSIYFSETRIASFSYLRCFDISNQMHEIVKQSVIVTSQLW